MSRHTCLRALATAALVTTGFVATASASPNYTCEYSQEALDTYDINGDGMLSDADSECVIEIALWDLAGSMTRPPSCAGRNYKKADVNNSGDVTVIDVLATVKALEFFGPCATFGDLNGSGVVNVADMQCMILAFQSGMFSGGMPPQCLATPEAADLNCDGDVSVIDVQLLIDVVQGNPLHSQIDANSNGVHDNCE